MGGCLTALLSAREVESSDWGWEKNPEVDLGGIGYFVPGVETYLSSFLWFTRKPAIHSY